MWRRPTTVYQARFTLLLVGCAMASAALAEEHTATYRIAGLCFPEREGDFRDRFQQIAHARLVSLDYEKAECTVTCDPAQLISNRPSKSPPTADEILAYLSERMSGMSRGFFKLKPVCPLAKDKLERVEIAIELLDCKACRLGAYWVIAGIDGVEQAVVSPETSRITAWIDASKTNRAALVGALKKAQVDVVAE